MSAKETSALDTYREIHGFDLFISDKLSSERREVASSALSRDPGRVWLPDELPNFDYGQSANYESAWSLGGGLAQAYPKRFDSGPSAVLSVGGLAVECPTVSRAPLPGPHCMRGDLSTVTFALLSSRIYFRQLDKHVISNNVQT